MKSLYNQFNDTLLHYGIKGTDHPYYDVMLANFMNYNLQKMYGSSDYETFVQSCALADSMKMPLYTGYATYKFIHTADMNSFINMLNHIDSNYSFDNSYRDSVAGVITVCVNLNGVPLSELWKYKDSLTSYAGGPIYSRIVNTPLAAIQTTGEIGFIYSDSSFHFSPADSGIIDLSTATFAGPYFKWVWIGGHFVLRNYYDVIASSGISPSTISQDVYDISSYIYNHNIPGAIFSSNYLSTIDGDYFKPEKQDYLRYVYSYQQLPPSEVLDSIQGQYLTSRIPSYSGYLANYFQPFNANAPANLYLGNSGMSNRLYDTLLKVINLADSTPSGIYPGHIFHSLNGIVYHHFTMELASYLCSDGTYWYRYFTTGDTLFNVRVSFPAYIPQALRTSYRVVSIAPVYGDSLNRYFTLGLHRGSDTTTIYVNGMASFVIGKCIELDNVLLGQPITEENVAYSDTFNNCERQLLSSAIRDGIVSYSNYYDSVKSAISGHFRSYVMDSVHEKLMLGYRNNEFNYTLYNYDRAGNLAFTVPPGGNTPIPNTGTTLEYVDTTRANNTPSLCPAPVYNKINTYNYNSFNEVKTQVTIDGGLTRFFYDAAGRLVFSQNAKQAPNGYYTYNIYDDQNRIIETGEAKMGCPYFAAHGPIVHHGGGSYCHYTYSIPAGHHTYLLLWSPDPYFIYNLDQVPYDSIVKQIRSYNRDDVVMTMYDTAAKNLAVIKGLDVQQNLRKRVSCVKYFEALSPIDTAYAHYNYATHYSYDIEGNVQTLAQDFPALATLKQQYKRVDYDYDLVSGKVNMLSYNRGWPDQFYQQYSYDADNRITEVQTSADGYIWKRDATYSYYQHGPLARLELGNLRVQGIDYAYTIQGWLKLMNSDTLNNSMDMGQDGITGGVTAPDAVAYSIDYFKNDYKPIGTSVMQHVAPVTHNLYNGNISRQTEAINTFQRLNKQYTYDQLNRIKNAAYATVSPVDYTLTGLMDFHNNYSYDPDGNLQKLVRYGNNLGSGAALMDSLTYKYSTMGNDDKLLQLYDDAADSGYTNNIAHYPTPSGTSTATRYHYDNIGNTTKDLVSAQDTIEWNLYNKVTQTQNNAAHNSMLFNYDGAGNRVAKYFTQATDTGNVENNNYYVHDAQGNILAIYKEQDIYVKVPIVWVTATNHAFRSAAGSVTFNDSFVTPIFAANKHFERSLLKYTRQNPDFEASKLSLPVSYYVAQKPSLYNDLLFADTSYIPPLIAADVSSGNAVIGNAFAGSLVFYLQREGLEKSKGIGKGRRYGKVSGATMKEEDAAAARSLNMMQQIFEDSVAGPHALGLLCQVTGGDSVLNFIATALSNSMEYDTTLAIDSTTGDTTYVVDSTMVTDTVATMDCDSLIQIIAADSLDRGLLGEAVALVSGLYYPATLTPYMELIGTDSTIYYDSALQQPMASWIQREVATFGRKRQVLQFFDNYDGGMPLLEQIDNPEQLLKIIYNADPGAYINSIDKVLGDSYIDTAIAKIPHLDLRTYLASASAAMSGTGTLAITMMNSLRSQDFSLAEHDLYGSSRIGVKDYYDQQVGLRYTVDKHTGIGTYTDTTRLWSKLPWYSLEYQDVIKADSLNLYGNGLTEQYYAQHILGQKQYELTDHLGDVLATVSDKRANGTFAATDGGTLATGTPATVLTWKPVVVSAYDYYPFGQYMPGRYMADTANHCFNTTITEMVHDIYYTFISNSGGSTMHGGAAFLPIDKTDSAVFTYSPGDGFSFDITGMPPDYDAKLTLTIPFIKGEYTATVTDDVDSSIIGSAVLDYSISGTATIPIHSHSGSATVTIMTATSYTGIILVTGLRAPHDTLQPHDVVTTVCNTEYYRYGFNGQMKDNEYAGLGNHYEYRHRGYNPQIGRFSTPDPVARSFPWNGAYNFAEDRVIDALDFEGLEVIIVNQAHDATIYNVGIKNTGRSEIDVYAHGTPRGIGNDETGAAHVWLNTEDQFDKYMAKNSDQWRNKKNNGETVVVLHSCRTGRTMVDKNSKPTAPSFAQKISGRFSITVIAPDERDNFKSGGELGPLVDKFEDDNGEHTSDDHSSTNKPGFWNVYKNGKLVESYKAGWTPKAKATKWDKFRYGRDIKDVPQIDTKPSSSQPAGGDGKGDTKKD